MDSIQTQRLKIWLGSFPPNIHQAEIEPYTLAHLAKQNTTTQVLRSLLDFLWSQITAAHNAIATIFRRIGYVTAAAMPRDSVRTISTMNQVIKGGFAPRGGLRVMSDALLRDEIVKAAKHWAWLKGLHENCLSKVTRLDGVTLEDLDLGLLGQH